MGLKMWFMAILLLILGLVLLDFLWLYSCYLLVQGGLEKEGGVPGEGGNEKKEVRKL